MSEKLVSNITLNSCRCVRCDTVLVSTDADSEDGVTCKCRAVTALGGHRYIQRTGNPAMCEEHSVWELTPVIAYKASYIRDRLLRAPDSFKLLLWDRCDATFNDGQLQPITADGKIHRVNDVISSWCDEDMAAIYDDLVAVGKSDKT